MAYPKYNVYDENGRREKGHQSLHDLTVQTIFDCRRPLRLPYIIWPSHAALLFRVTSHTCMVQYFQCIIIRFCPRFSGSGFVCRLMSCDSGTAKSHVPNWNCQCVIRLADQDHLHGSVPFPTSRGFSLCAG